LKADYRLQVKKSFLALMFSNCFFKYSKYFSLYIFYVIRTTPKKQTILQSCLKSDPNIKEALLS